MTTNKQNIENLFKEGFKDYSVSPKNSVWKKINRKLNINNFLRFSPDKFNIYYSMAIGITTIILLYNVFDKKQVVEQNEILTNNEIIITEHNSNVKINTIENEKIIKELNKETKIIIEDNQNIINKNTEKKLSQTDLLTNESDVNKVITEVKSNDEDNKNLKLAEEPFADFSASIYKACVPVAVHFTNASENCDSYLWNFGNEETSSEKNPTFVFRAAGEYTVTLTVISGSISKSVSKLITVYPKPKSEFIISDKDNIYENDEVTFANISTGFKTCFWDFGDDNTSSFIHPTHTYDNSGIYNISLICFTENNCSDTSEYKNLQIRDLKYQIIAPNATYCNRNGQNSGYNNGNNSNTVFSPIFNFETSEYRLRIFNRFGSIVFESNDPDYGWNGYFNNKPVNEDTYIWECSGKFEDGQAFLKTGSVHLLYTRNQ